MKSYEFRHCFDEEQFQVTELSKWNLMSLVIASYKELFVDGVE